MKHISEFRKKKGLDKKLDLSAIQVALECAAEAHKLGFDYIANIDNETEKDGFIIHTHLNLLGRIYEQIEGMLTCIATQSFTSAEALARVIEEASINLMYMALNGDERTITAYMVKWHEEHIRKLNEWKEEIKDKDYSDQVTPLIDGRIAAINNYSEYIELAKSNFAVSKEECNDLWFNSLFKRFDALGKAADYFSIYHRLSGSSHLTAEDTILYMMTLQLPIEYRQLIAFEACSYSVMMSRIVINSFIDAVAFCCIRQNLTDEVSLKKFKDLKNKIELSVEEISKDAGVPGLSEEESKDRFLELKNRFEIHQ